MDRCRWANLVRNKLVPAHLLIPTGVGIHEWSRAYRNLLFDMARFAHAHGGVATEDLARAFRRSQDREALRGFSESEVCLLMAKSLEYGLSPGSGT